jgi:hypothetical protein
VLLERLVESAGSFADDPRIMEVALPSSPASAAQARRALADFCVEHAVPEELAELGILAISELVTNVILHAGTPTIVWAEYDEGALTVATTDGETTLPALLAPDGRGRPRHRPDRPARRQLGADAHRRWQGRVGHLRGCPGSLASGP